MKLQRFADKYSTCIWCTLGFRRARLYGFQYYLYY